MNSLRILIQVRLSGTASATSSRRLIIWGSFASRTSSNVSSAIWYELLADTNGTTGMMMSKNFAREKEWAKDSWLAICASAETYWLLNIASWIAYTNCIGVLDWEFFSFAEWEKCNRWLIFWIVDSVCCSFGSLLRIWFSSRSESKIWASWKRSRSSKNTVRMPVFSKIYMISSRYWSK